MSSWFLSRLAGMGTSPLSLAPCRPAWMYWPWRTRLKMVPSYEEPAFPVHISLKFLTVCGTWDRRSAQCERRTSNLPNTEKYKQVIKGIIKLLHHNWGIVEKKILKPTIGGKSKLETCPIFTQLKPETDGHYKYKIKKDNRPAYHTSLSQCVPGPPHPCRSPTCFQEFDQTWLGLDTS